MNKDWVIQVQGSYYYTNKSKNDDRLDFNFYDAVVFKNQSKDEVILFAEELYRNNRCFWNVIEYDKALKEYEDRTFVTINDKKYRWGSYLEVKEALRMARQGIMIGYKYNNGSVIVLDKNIEVIPVNAIIEATWRTIEAC